MRLRSRFHQQLMDRIRASLPGALATVWDHDGLSVFAETLQFRSAGGHDGNWSRLASVTGVMRAELVADGADQLTVEPLISDLVASPVFLPWPAALPGEHGERGRFKLLDLRDTVHDRMLVTMLRFDVEAEIGVMAAAYQRPTLMTSQPPATGAGQAGSYIPVEEL